MDRASPRTTAPDGEGALESSQVGIEEVKSVCEE